MEPELDSLQTFPIHLYTAVLRRRRAIIIQSFVLIAVVGIVVTLMSPKVYQSSAKLLVDGPSYNLNTIDTENPLSGLLSIGQQQDVETQVEVLQAEPLLDQVDKNVGDADLKVEQIGSTNVIAVTSEAENPKTAAAAPNELLKLYIAQDTDQTFGEIVSAKDFCVKQEALARQRLVAADKALLAFNEKNHVSDMASSRTAEATRATSLTDKLNSDRIQLASLQAQIASVRSTLSGEPQTVASSSQTTNPSVAALKAQIADLDVQRVGLVQPGGFTAQAPQVRALDARISLLKANLALQPAFVATQTVASNADRQAMRAKLQGLTDQEAALNAESASVNTQLAAATDRLESLSVSDLQLSVLQRAHDTAAADDKMFLDQLDTLALRAKARHVSAHIIEPAAVPTDPIRPKKAQGIVFACLVGLFIGVVLAMLQEFLDDRINTAEEATEVTSLPSLGRVPVLTASDARLLPLMQGLDPATESYRVLRTNIHFASIDQPLHTLLVTSGSPGEGKTTTTANLAFAMAMDGKRVIVVDCDLRRPNLHNLLEVPPTPGLTDVLLGKCTLDEALIEHDSDMDLSVLVVGSRPPNPAELVGSRAFGNIVQELKQRADIVIFDSPPINAVADSQILASQMDGVILVIATGETKKAVARRTMMLLKQSRAKLLGFASNKTRWHEQEPYYYKYFTGKLAEEAPSKNGSHALPMPREEEVVK